MRVITKGDKRNASAIFSCLLILVVPAALLTWKNPKTDSTLSIGARMMVI